MLEAGLGQVAAMTLLMSARAMEFVTRLAVIEDIKEVVHHMLACVEPNSAHRSCAACCSDSDGCSHSKPP